MLLIKANSENGRGEAFRVSDLTAANAILESDPEAVSFFWMLIDGDAITTPFFSSRGVFWESNDQKVLQN